MTSVHRLVVTAALMVMASCNGILGIEDRPLRDDTVEGGTPDGGTPDGGTPDGGTADASVPSAYREAILADKPLVYLRFGESGGAIGHDEMGHLDATYPSSGVTLGAPGALQNDPSTAIVLDGTGIIRMPAGVDFEQLAPFSVEAWFRASASGLADITYLIDHETYGPRQGWDLLVGRLGVYFERWEGTVGPATVMEPPPAADAWHHVVGAFDGTMQRLYVDARLVSTATEARARLARVPGGFTIGGQNCACSGNRYVGSLDELAIYDYALSEARVSAHFKAARP